MKNGLFVLLLLCHTGLVQAQQTPDNTVVTQPVVNWGTADTFRIPAPISASLKPAFRVPPPVRFTQQQLIAPATLIVAGILSNGNGEEGIKKEIREMRNANIEHFHTKIDNYLQYSPVFVAYALDAIGIKSRNSFVERTAILIKGEIFNYATVSLLKRATRQLRPDETTYNSWPSGHTANAFAAATFLSEEYKHRFKWMPYAAYGLAGTVGALRIANNRHYISDVLAGAGFGYLSMKLAYWTHQYKWSKKHNKNYPVF